MDKKDGRTIPARKHLETCKRLGIQVLPHHSNKDVYLMIQAAIKKPNFKAIYDQLEGERQAVAEAEEREYFGNDLYDAIQKWSRLCSRPMKQYATVYKKGKQIKWDILELENVTSDEVSISSIRVAALAPKKKKERDLGNYIEWEKEIQLKPEQILIIQELPKPIDMYDVTAYEKLLSVCGTWALKFKD